MQSGSLVLLKIKEPAGEFRAVGGMRTTSFTLNNQMVDSSCKLSGSWRQLMSGAGISSVSLAGAGIFTGSVTESLVRQYAFAGQVQNYQLCFGNGDVLIGDFFITSYERAGNYGEEETYLLSLESAGVVEYLARDIIN